MNLSRIGRRLEADQNGSEKQTMDPILQLDVGAGRFVTASLDGDMEEDKASKRKSSASAAISALCFLASESANEPAGHFPGMQSSMTGGFDSDDSDDSDQSLELQCERLRVSASISSNHCDRTIPVSSRWLGTALSNGEVLLWDLHQRRIAQTLMSLEDRRAAALCLQRLEGDPSCYILHTRDGLISRHNIHHSGGKSRSSSTTITMFRATLSATFCAAAVCIGDATTNLFALPDTVGAVVRDWRQSQPTHTIVLSHNDDGNDVSRGFVTSLAMLQHDSDILVACGMEDGSIQLRDLRYNPKNRTCKKAGISIGMDPVLSMDIRPSFNHASDTAVIAAGMAGNVNDLSSLNDAEQGRGVICKVSNLNSAGQVDPIQARIRTRFCAWKERANHHRPQSRTGKMATQQHWYKANRAGISVCRFDATGEVVALGGWDYRLRLYRRSTGQPLALLRGHNNSITAMDWAPKNNSSLLATGSGDGTVLVWNYPRRSAP